MVLFYLVTTSIAIVLDWIIFINLFFMRYLLLPTLSITKHIYFIFIYWIILFLSIFAHVFFSVCVYLLHNSNVYQWFSFFSSFLRSFLVSLWKNHEFLHFSFLCILCSISIYISISIYHLRVIHHNVDFLYTIQYIAYNKKKCWKR